MCLIETRYRNHIVGKWHLGHFKREYTPLYRGFESHVGYWTGRHDYFDHTAVGTVNFDLTVIKDNNSELGITSILY